MGKFKHEIRDPIHVFIHLDSHERKVLDSRSFQRLRYIHQLALTYLVYPGATHRRFEHSLGVMELASRVYDVITRPENIPDEIEDIIPLRDRSEHDYWRKVLRMAALCHDIGHLPFSHAAEKELLPEGWDHERLTGKFIQSDELHDIWQSVRPIICEEDLIKLALGPKDAPPDLIFSDWETILSEIIVGDAFGVDRMDYLLRDSHHLGVAYGKFDHYRLIDTLRILPQPPVGDDGKDRSKEPSLGVEEGGIQSAEALLLARYFMYSQVYFHPIRRIYDIHLKDFLKEWLPLNYFPTSTNELISLTDNEVTAALLKAAFDTQEAGHSHAKRIVCREHFKRIYQRNPSDQNINPNAGKALYDALRREFRDDLFRFDSYVQKGDATYFPVKMDDGRIESSVSVSQVLKKLPVIAVDYIFAERSIFEEAEKWLNKNRADLIQLSREEDDG